MGREREREKGGEDGDGDKKKRGGKKMVVPSDILQKLLYIFFFFIIILQLYYILSYFNDNNNRFKKRYYYNTAKGMRKRKGVDDMLFSQTEFISNNNNNNNNNEDDYYYYCYYDQEKEDDDDDDVEKKKEDMEERNNNNNNNNSNDHSGATINDDDNDDENDSFFPKCHDKFNNNKDCVTLNYQIFDKHTHKKLLDPDLNQKYLLPNSQKIPRRGGRNRIGYCGFGKLLYDAENKEWSCQCFAPDFFGGETCDEIGKTLIKENNCTRVAHASDVLNTDVSTFNPFSEGICSRCVSPDTQAPVINAGVPLCKSIVNNNDEDDKEEEDDDSSSNNNNKRQVILDRSNPCKYDALNPHLFSSPNNFYVPGYGCVCDYHNGFVEVALPSSQNYIKKEEISNACIKIGKDQPSSFHRADVAYYTLNGNFKPIQVHSFKELEHPFNIIFPKARELLVKQTISKDSDNYDWLNRVIKPKRKHPIRRLNYPKSKWPVVHKRSLVNHYSTRSTTYPISAYRLANGCGNEAKHWYEVTTDRYMANAVLGRPIVYTYYTGTPWTGRVTLNPLGALYGKYYGATLMTKPGEVVRLDTRGYESEESYLRDNRNIIIENIAVTTGNNNNNNTANTAVTIPPDYKKEMMDESTIVYVPLLFISYEITD